MPFMKWKLSFLAHVLSFLPSRLPSFQLKADLLMGSLAGNFSLVTRLLGRLHCALLASAQGCHPSSVQLLFEVCCGSSAFAWCLSRAAGHAGAESPSSVWLCCSPACWQQKGKAGRELGARVTPASCYWDTLPPSLSPGPKGCSRAQVAGAVQEPPGKNILYPAETKGVPFL